MDRIKIVLNFPQNESALLGLNKILEIVLTFKTVKMDCESLAMMAPNNGVK